MAGAWNPKWVKGGKAKKIGWSQLTEGLQYILTSGFYSAIGQEPVEVHKINNK